MDILLIGEHFSDNLGDGILCKVIEKVILEETNQKSNIHLLDLSGRTGFEVVRATQDSNIEDKSYLKKRIMMNILPDTCKKYMKKIYYNKILVTLDEINRIKKINRQLNKYNHIDFDIAIFAGGQLFMDYFIKPIYLISNKLSSKSINIVFNCCGLGRNDSKINRAMLKKSLNLVNVKSITIRDNYESFIKNYNNKKLNIKRTVDSGIITNRYFEANESKKNVFGIGIMDPQIIRNNGIDITDKQYIDLIKGIINNLEENNKEWEVFTNGSIGDYNKAKQIIEHDLGYKEGSRIAERPINPEELVKTITKYSNIISMRLHSHIIAYSFNIPSIGFVWDKKVAEFAELINRKQCFFTFNECNIVNKMFDVINSEEFKIDLKHREELQHDARKLIINNIFN